MGVRLGKELVVVNAFNLTVIRSENLNNITVPAEPGLVTISVNPLRLMVTVSPAGIEISINEDSILSGYLGLCGNNLGNFVYRNGTAVDTTDPYSLNKAIAQYLTPPSETFARMVARRQCGKYF